MDKPEFDPNKPFESSKPAFDPSQGFTTPAAIDPSISKTESTLRGGAQGATLGAGDELSAALEAGLFAPAQSLLTGENNYGPQGFLDAAFNPSTQLENYRRSRDTLREQNASAQAANPKSYLAGNVAGGILPAIATMGGSAAPAAAGEGAGGLEATYNSLHNLMGQGAKAGALIGFNNSNADLTQGDLPGVLQDAGESAVGGAAMGGAFGTLGESIPPEAIQALKEKANLARVAALGPTKRVLSKLLNQDQIDRLGGFLKSNKVMGPLTGRPQIQENLEDLMNQSGEEIGNIVNQADTMNAGNVAPSAVPGVIRRSRYESPDLFENLPFKPGENASFFNYQPESEIATSEPWERATGLGVGSKDPVTFQHTLGPDVISVDKTSVPELSKNFIDAHGFINDAQNQIIQPLRQMGTKAAQSAADQIEGELQAVASVHQPGDYMSFSEVQNMVKDLRDSAKVFAREGNSASAKAYENYYGLLRDHQQNALDALSTSNYLSPEENLATQFSTQRNQYNLAKQANDIVSNKLGAESANRALSPTDYVSGASGMIKYGVPGATTAVVGNQIVRKLGNQIAASSYDAAASGLSGIQKIMGTLAQNPSALGRYGSLLLNAAQQGPENLNVTHYVLSETDQNYRQQINEINGIQQ